MLSALNEPAHRFDEIARPANVRQSAMAIVTIVPIALILDGVGTSSAVGRLRRGH